MIINHELSPIPLKRGRKKERHIIGQLGGGKSSLNGIIDIAIMQSLVNEDDVKALVRDYGQIIVDECHHVSAVNFERILRFANSKYILGLTATPIRQDGQHPIIFLQCGEIRYKVNTKVEAINRGFEHYIIPRFTSLKKYSITDESKITTIYNDLMLNDARNNLIVNDVIKAYKDSRNIIILTERIDHIQKLSEMLKGKCENIIALSGKMSAKEKKIAENQISQLNNCDKFILIATGKYIGEGFDFPRLDTLFLAMPIAWKGKVAQYAGRLHRVYDGKEDVQIYDYVDIHIPVLERMYHKRVKSYSSIGYRTKDIIQSDEKTEIIYDNNNYKDIFNSDIRKARTDILIFSPYIRRFKLSQFVGELSKCILNGVKVTVVTRPPDDFKVDLRNNVIDNIEYLKQANIVVKLQTNIQHKFAVIDSKIVWYGNINFLNHDKVEESIMRIESLEIANELLSI